MPGPVWTPPGQRHAVPLETLVLTNLPDEAVPAYEAALQSVCRTVGYFREPPAEETWRIEAVWDRNGDEAALAAALALAALVSGHEAGPPERSETEAEGWLARTVEAFPEQPVGTRFLIRPTHVPDPRRWDRVVLRLDAGLAFGSGEHASTQGCLTAFERVAARRPRRILDLGTGSGILAMAAAKILRRPVLATDIEPWSVRVADENGRMNGLRNLLRARLADGWRSPSVGTGTYDLVFANILARPLCAMAKDLALHLAPGGTAILAGLLGTQVRMVLAAHRRQGMVLERRLDLGPWSTLVLRKR
ncbi:50S ribosomal protein L11 methyltransferase [Roseomonas sp. OT10]|uniref:50S ribosomal protein L11 methyltransferase n=1 Tax=Roseomonas cutis TaxID=2897332 RepID=UPI001E4F1464|nr:50S ribosomal protein L11 methyltransferase [Roseomonas sp. OT10]UFN49566.1 50S ribosomal protein L11 methyltransferase [Roseomonas sp. OT10]